MTGFVITVIARVDNQSHETHEGKTSDIEGDTEIVLSVQSSLQEDDREDSSHDDVTTIEHILHGQRHHIHGEERNCRGNEIAESGNGKNCNINLIRLTIGQTNLSFFFIIILEFSFVENENTEAQ